MATINFEFGKDIKKFGADDFDACYNCGTCTAVCGLSDADNSFPRKMIRYTVLGLDSEIQSSVDPWLCYYCGDCSTSCPRKADPANLMMALRRYLVSKYDWTGISKRIYTSVKFELGILFFIASLVLTGFIVFHGEMTTQLTSQGGVKLNTFAPWQVIEMVDWTMAAFLAFFLLSNVANMYYKIVIKGSTQKIPFKLHFTKAYELIVHFISQKRLTECDTEKISVREKLKQGKLTYWLMHLFLMTGYVTLFIMIVGFLGWFQTDEIHAWYHPQRLLGYYGTFGLISGIIYFSVLRIKKSNEKSKKSHFTDWTFLILLMLTSVTGILVHFFRVNGMPYATYITYVIHMMVLIPMLIIEVPFSKWSHLAFRPFAVYFSALVNGSVKKAATK